MVALACVHSGYPAAYLRGRLVYLSRASRTQRVNLVDVLSSGGARTRGGSPAI